MPGSELAVAEDEDTGEAAGYVTISIDPDSRIGWIHNLAVDAGLRGPGAGSEADRACPGPLPCPWHDRGQDRDPRPEPGRAAPLPELGFQEIARQIHFAMPLEARTGRIATARADIRLPGTT